MAKITKRYKKAPAIRELALRLVFDVSSKDWAGEVEALFNYVRDHIRYVKDIYGCETLQSPIQTLRIGQGDCDDHCILLASLLMAIGHPCRFVAVGFMGETLSHVIVQTKIGQSWVTLDATMKNWQMGRSPRGIKAKMVENIK